MLGDGGGEWGWMVIPNILIQFEIKSIEQEVGWCTQTGTQMTDFNSKITVFGRRGREGERRRIAREGQRRNKS